MATSLASTNKVIAITGASSGMGHLLAQKALAEGYFVIVNARRAEALAKIKNLSPERVKVVVGNIVDEAIQKQIVEEATRLGRLDYLVNNAGFGFVGRLETEVKTADMIQLNVTALIQLTQKCLPILKATKNARILNVASVLGTIVLPFMTTYCATKYAVVGFTKALNIELAGTGVSATAYCPSGVKTEFNAVAAGGEKGQRFDRMGEEADKVVSSIWKNRNTSADVYFPTWRAALTVRLTRLLGPFITQVLKTAVIKKGDRIIG